MMPSASITIYYFSGTGNSLAVAKNIADQMRESELVNMAKTVAGEETIGVSGAVGFVFPVYFEDLPNIVKNFVEKLSLKGGIYIFGIATCGSGPGLAFYSLDRILRKKGKRLSAGFAVEMPDNVVILLNRIPPIDVQESMLSRSKEKIMRIAETVRKRDCIGMEGRERLRDKLEGLLVKAIVTRIYRTPRKFRATTRCVKCGICRKICPTNNIKIYDDKVLWGENCEQCLACLHWCPTHAIVLGKGSPNSTRYHHPDITVEEMMLR